MCAARAATVKFYVLILSERNNDNWLRILLFPLSFVVDSRYAVTHFCRCRTASSLILHSIQCFQRRKLKCERNSLKRLELHLHHNEHTYEAVQRECSDLFERDFAYVRNESFYLGRTDFFRPKFMQNRMRMKRVGHMHRLQHIRDTF